ncbi:DUF4133 domain-containing protein [Mucilaginibacter sp. RS28]|uniref:DUF4133 domain-containing protein n=1 Tax=Mucilaginibacter straminoryzae TaxID=2932774 RepID=A0A9X1X210_9SPHI|nr:DUF4133 domain-containing protein [Mucilaginibacter straminoryzae]MCJ8208108.1 DUF4133 domain-containing protein [Mucilaginibacter straminoryzae]
MSSVYPINKGIGKPLEFRGLKAQYIAYLAAGLVILLLAFATLYMFGCGLLLLMPMVVIIGSGLFYFVFRYSHKYGQYGLMKKAARAQLPNAIRIHSRSIYQNIRS